VVGETANDFALAIAYDRTYGFGDWISPDWFSDITHINMKLMLRGYAPSGPDRADKVLVTTCSGQDAMLSTVAEALNNPIVRVVRDLADADPPPVATVTPRVTFDKDGRLHLGVVDQWSQSWAAPVIHVGDGTIIMETTCPIPSVLHPDLAASERLSWQIDVQFYPRKCPADRGIDQSALLVDNSGFFHTWVRSARDGISYQSLRFDFVAAGTPPQQRLATPKLRRPGLSEWVELVSAQRGLTVTPSAAGRQSAVLERLWGSRENLAFAMGGPIRTVLRAFLPTAVSSAEAYPNNEGVILAGEGFMTFDGMRSLGGEFEDERHLRVEVDEALMHRVLRRGLILRCAECGYSAFTPIDRLEQVNRCQRCDSPNELTHWHWKMPLHEPTWYYDLHRAVRGFLAQDGDVPLLLSHHLRTGRQHVADVGELEFLDADTGKKLAEADLIALVGQDVVVAEAKKNGSLGTGRQAGRAAAKRVELADVLSADQILLATTADSWDQGSVDALRSAVRGRRWTTGGAPTIRIVSGLGSNSVVDTVIDPPAPDAAVDH